MPSTLAHPPRRALVLAAIAAVGFGLPTAPALAQDDTALARQVFADVNKRLPEMKRVTTKAKRADVSYQSAVKAWAESGGAIRKIEVTDLDDSGDVVSEYYYQSGALVFAYVAVKGFNDKGKQATRVEERQYFRDEKMFKWLSGLEKAPVPPASKDFAAESTLRSNASRTYLRAAQAALLAGK